MSQATRGAKRGWKVRASAGAGPGSAHKRARPVGGTLDLSDMKQGHRGFLVTCETGREKQTRAHMADWLAEHIETLEQQEQQERPPQQQQQRRVASIEEDIAAEIAAAKSESGGSPLRLVDIGGAANGLCMLQMSKRCPVDPVAVARSVVLHAFDSRASRAPAAYTVIPLQACAYASPADVVKAGEPALRDYFGQRRALSKTFAIQVRRRHCANFDRDEVIALIIAFIKSLWPAGEWASIKADLKNPETVVLVEAVRNVAGIAVVQNYGELHRFNVQTAANGGETVKPQGQAHGGAEAGSKPVAPHSSGETREAAERRGEGDGPRDAELEAPRDRHAPHHKRNATRKGKATRDDSAPRLEAANTADVPRAAAG
jgi:tRNA(Ser,Leu) C12 N-acetylase TAN1